MHIINEVVDKGPLPGPSSQLLCNHEI